MSNKNRKALLKIEKMKKVEENEEFISQSREQEKEYKEGPRDVFLISREGRGC